MKIQALFFLTALFSSMYPVMAMQSGGEEVVASNESCPICLEVFADSPADSPIETFSCNHRIHTACNHELMDCPYCRTVVLSRGDLRSRMEESLALIGSEPEVENDFARALRCQSGVNNPEDLIQRGKISTSLLLEALSDETCSYRHNIEELIVQLDIGELHLGARMALRKEERDIFVRICNELRNRQESLENLIRCAEKLGDRNAADWLRQLNLN